MCCHAAYKITKPTKHPRQKLSKPAILKSLIFHLVHNARLRGWQRITPNPNTTTITTAAHWDWKR
ncbi:hypothetical protein DYC00_18030, partial [Vibrio cholerae]|nr:hypothetical protein [Vibrio cholerae]